MWNGTKDQNKERCADDDDDDDDDDDGVTVSHKYMLMMITHNKQ